MNKSTYVPPDTNDVADRLSRLADQLQQASGELSRLVGELKEQSDDHMGQIQQEIIDERAKHE